MANYYETARTNYFRVKDEAAFNAFMDTVPGAEIAHSSTKPGMVCVLFTDETVPSSRYNEETEDWDEFDFMAELAPHLADKSIAVLEAAGSEKLRYICGYAIAVNNKGEQVSVNINEIYKLATEEFGSDTEITEAHY